MKVRDRKKFLGKQWARAVRLPRALRSGLRKQEKPEINPAGPYNAKQPFVLLDLKTNNTTRGDTHGYLGLAKRITAATGARFLQIDSEMLADMFPDVQKTDLSDYYTDMHDLRLEKFFEREGYPDFYFNTMIGTHATKVLNEKGSGIIISSYNESLSSSLNLGPDHPHGIVPHHITPTDFAFEGRRFAEEFGEMQRPFIAVNFVDLYGENACMAADSVVASCFDLDRATIFVCSCHRTTDASLKAFVETLQQRFSRRRDNFSIVVFDYNANLENYGVDGFWNPYVGMIDQADHIILAGHSYSMASEPLAAGKIPYTFNHNIHASQKNYVRSVFSLAADRIDAPVPAVDVSQTCADAIVALHRKNVAAAKERLAKPPRWKRRKPTADEKPGYTRV